MRTSHDYQGKSYLGLFCGPVLGSLTQLMIKFTIGSHIECGSSGHFYGPTFFSQIMTQVKFTYVQSLVVVSPFH